MRTVTFRDALREAIREEMARDERVFIMGEDIAGYGGTYGVTRGLIEEVGEKRVRDTPLAEEIITGAGNCAALNGLRPSGEIKNNQFSLLATHPIFYGEGQIRCMVCGL